MHLPPHVLRDNRVVWMGSRGKTFWHPYRVRPSHQVAIQTSAAGAAVLKKKTVLIHPLIGLLNYGPGTVNRWILPSRSKWVYLSLTSLLKISKLFLVEILNIWSRHTSFIKEHNEKEAMQMRQARSTLLVHISPTAPPRDTDSGPSSGLWQRDLYYSARMWGWILNLGPSPVTLTDSPGPTQLNHFPRSSTFPHQRTLAVL